MKRSELKVGDELYHARRGDWQYRILGSKVIVLATEPYVWDKWGRRNVPAAPGKPGKVLVRETVTWSDQPQETLVSLSELRGPYEETLAEVEQQRAEDKAQREADERAQEERNRLRAEQRVARKAVIERADGMGFKVEKPTGPNSVAVIIAYDELNAMLNRIQQLDELHDIEASRYRPD